MFLRDRHQLAAEEVELAAEEGELAADLADGLEVGRKTLEEPHEFQVTPSFSLEQATRSKAVEVAVDIELEQVGGVVGRAASVLEDGMGEGQGGKIQGIDEGVQEADGVVLGDVVIEGLREESELVSVGSFDVLHPRPPDGQTRRPDLP